MPNEKPEIDPLDLIGVFARSSNFPKTKDALQFLAAGLAKASKVTGVEMSAIVDACAEISEYCPTDAELLTVGRNIREARQRETSAKRNIRAEWEAECGPPRPFALDDAQIMKNGDIARQKREHMQAIMYAEWKRTHPGQSRREYIRMDHLPQMRLQIWAQQQAGIDVTPTQRREVSEEYYQPPQIDAVLAERRRA